jgi:transcriptional regulator with XRE-family HTH domain
LNGLGRASKVSKKSEGVDEKSKRDEFLVEIGERVRRARDAADLTQRELGEAAGGISPAYIYLVENGRQNITLRIAEALGVTIEALLAGAESGIAPTEQSLRHWTRTVGTLIEEVNERRRQDVGLLKELERLSIAHDKVIELLTERKATGSGKAGGKERPKG